MKESEAVAVFGRHMVGLELAGNGIRKIYSAFVTEFGGRSVLFTAGHIIAPLQHANIPNGEIVAVLHDATGFNPRFQTPLPFDFDLGQWIVLGEREGEFDCAFVELTRSCASSLIANGIEPFASPRSWWDSSMPAKWFVEAGVPAGFCDPEGEEFSVVALALRRTSKPPDVTDPFIEPLYFEIHPAAEDFSPVGMSGGPVFALTQDTTTGSLYTRLVGIQSGWYPALRVVSVCPIALLFEQLRTWVDATA